MTETSCRNLLRLPALFAFLGNMGSPPIAFCFVPSTVMKKPGAPLLNNLAVVARDNQHQHRSTSAATTLLLSSPSGFSNNNSQEQNMRDKALQESGQMPPPDDFPNTNSKEQFPQEAQESGRLSSSDISQKRMDPLIASLTRIDEPTPTRNIPLFGEVPADGNLALLVPAAAIGVLGFIFSILVAFKSRDLIVQEMSKVELPEMKYTETVVKEGQCRGLCSSQDGDFPLRNLMESLSRKD